MDLILDVATRWNSTHSMLERLCSLRIRVEQVLRNPDVVKPGSTDHLHLRDEVVHHS